jgi:two-component system cell cycle sensor histidine kinase/response regulator CckA
MQRRPFTSATSSFGIPRRWRPPASLRGGFAHDFNNLLAAIIGYCDPLHERAGAFDESARADLRGIRLAADWASSLTKQILAFSRRQALSPSVVSLNVVLEGMGSLLRRTLGADIDLAVKADSDLGLVDIDVHEFERVLLNLAVNARDAMSGGGLLTIETADVTLDKEYCRTHAETVPGRHVMLAVSDTGTGMDEATLQRVFEPFFTTKVRGEGTGLGLSMVHAVLYMSGYTRNAIVHAGRLDSGVHFLEKPFAPDALARAVREALSGTVV